MTLALESMLRLSTTLQSERLARTDLAEEGGVLLDLAGQQILSLNRVGLYLVDLICQDTVSREALAQRMAQDFALDLTTARADVDAFVGRLAQFLGIPA